MTCPDCKSVVLFGEHYHRPGCEWGTEKTDASQPVTEAQFADHLHVYRQAQEISEEERANFDPWELADRERDESDGR